MLKDNQSWKENGKNGDRPHKRIKCVMGIDMSVKDDITAISLLWGMNKKIFVYNEYFLPKQTIDKHKNTPLYQQWVRDGFMQVCGDAVIDDALLFQRIIDLGVLFDIQAIGYDPKGMQEVNNRIKALRAGHLLKAIPQTALNLSPAMLAMQTAIMKDDPDIRLCYNPITEWMFGNVVLIYDNGGNMRAMKAATDSPNKIDGVAAIVDALCAKG